MIDIDVNPLAGMDDVQAAEMIGRLASTDQRKLLKFASPFVLALLPRSSKAATMAACEQQRKPR